VKVRVATGNAALKRADGKRLFFIARHCKETAESFAKWEMHPKLGVPNRASRYTHLVDCGTYVEYRLRARPAPKGNRTATFLRPATRADQLRGL
jgi:hypothetical protein